MNSPAANNRPRSNFLVTWQAAHRRLLQEDSQYRKRFHTYLATLICLSCALSIFYLPFFGIRLFAPMVDISLILDLAALIVALTLRQLHFQNKSITRYLKTAQSNIAVP